MKGRAWARRVCLVGIGLLYVASVPWYRENDAPMRIWLGLPDWVAVALLCYVGVASLNAVAWHWTDVPDVADVADEPGGLEESGGLE